MKLALIQLGILSCFASALTGWAGTCYVDAGGTNPVPPFDSWATAAQTIQDAVDAANAGDEILVNDGVYASGGRVVFGKMTNRVAVTKAVTVRSVNGPAATVIAGYKVPGATYGDNAVRCVYLTNGAALIGFTLTNGATRAAGDSVKERSGGAVWCESKTLLLSNCIISDSSAPASGGGVFQGTLRDCTLIRNYAYSGGGGYSNFLYNCLVLSNTASYYGGGASGSTLSNCTVTGNSSGNSGGGLYQGKANDCTFSFNSGLDGGGGYQATSTNCLFRTNSVSSSGGGTMYSTLYKCTLIGNSAAGGGGSSGGTLYSCTLTGNSASSDGGGAYSGTLNNCLLTGNSALNGGASSSATHNNCTLIGNSAKNCGGAFTPTALRNCIVYYNSALTATNYSGGSISFTCTTPLPSGPGNIDAEPQLASFSHLSIASPCHGTGSATYATGLDIDGEPWARPPSMGCDEPNPDTATGPITVAFQANYTNVVPGFSVDFVAGISGEVSASRWEFGDGTILSNRPYASHQWSATGDFPVVLRTFNADNSDGVTATTVVHVISQTNYAAASSSTPAWPYDSWAAAAMTIQDAIDAAPAGGTVLVSDGVYATGGRKVYGSMLNRVAVYKPLTLRSINGAAQTVVVGYQSPGTTNGVYSIRCAFLTNASSLIGFTLTNGATRVYGDATEINGGGVWCDLTAVVSDCVLVGNSAGSSGGGAYQGTLTNCVFTANSASKGGGASTATLDHCVLTNNTAAGGGGAYKGKISNSTLAGNSASSDGGGAYQATLRNCALTGNSTSNTGGGSYDSTLYNCTLTGNSAGGAGGGAHAGTLYNCIIYHNPRGGNTSSSTLDHCCTTPLFAVASGNMDFDPQLAGSSHLGAASPCRGAGSGAYATGLDVDGEPWANPPSIGCDEPYPGISAGPLGVAIQANYTNVATGFPVDFTGTILGQASANCWDFGDGTIVSNRLCASHQWAEAGDFLVVLRAFNAENPGGLAAAVLVHVTSETHYVSPDSAQPTVPYDSWATAANNIQDAVDVAATPGALILVTNGVYGTGGRVVYGSMTNRLAVTRPVRVQSVNGPLHTIIAGNQVPGTIVGDAAVRCVYLASGAALAGFTLSNGATRGAGDPINEQYGGGLWCESDAALVSNCILVRNAATCGGAAYRGTFYNCVLATNSASSGGGAYQALLNNCTVVANFAYDGAGGGVCNGILKNCIVYYNTNYSGSNFYSSGLKYCCTIPLPDNSPGNFTNAPLFVDLTSADLHLQPGSPCINAGRNAFATSAVDLDGQPRIVGGTVDVGAYEYQGMSSRMSQPWLQQYGLPEDGSLDDADADGDGMTNWQEWVAGTDPKDANSALGILSATHTLSGITISWSSVSNRFYSLERGGTLGAAQEFSVVRNGIQGVAGTTTVTDADASGPGPFFYRVRVEQ